MGLNSNLVSLINNLSDFNLSNHQAKSSMISNLWCSPTNVNEKWEFPDALWWLCRVRSTLTTVSLTISPGSRKSMMITPEIRIMNHWNELLRFNFHITFKVQLIRPNRPSQLQCVTNLKPKSIRSTQNEYFYGNRTNENVNGING